ncbi:MAG: extracellular solute-binding protein [Rhodobacteraceae bacterium]|nr:extracellular solute-binding protein [Paracoccaceae bacterium]
MASPRSTVSAATADAGPGRLIASGLLILGLAAATVSAARAEETITAHGISTFGDLKYPADFAHLEYVNPDAPKGGEMSQWAFGNFDSMNPYSEKGRAAGLSSIMYESILVGTADEIGSAYCLLCTTLEYPVDRSWVIFNLRDDVKFSDGTPMTADDVLFSYETFLAKGLTDFRTLFAQRVEKAEVLGPLQIKFTFKEGVPWRDMPQEVGSLSIMSRAHYEGNNRDLSLDSLEPFLGTGQYVLDSMDVGRSVTYRRNPDYWGNTHPLNIGQGNFDTIRLEYYGDYQAAFEGFKAGNYLFRNEASSKEWATSYDFPAVQDGTVLKVALPNGNKANGQAFIFNLRRDKFQDIRVRQAIALMFNFEWSNKTLFYDLYARIHSVWENSDLAATGTPPPEEVALLQPLVDQGLLNASILTDPAVMAPTSGDRQIDRGNLRAASALLDAAGWTVGDDGIRRNATGQKLSVEFLNASPSFDRIMLPYVENLVALGVDARMTSVDPAQFESRVRPEGGYDFDMITDNARSNYISGNELLQYYGSETADVSTFNAMGLKSPAVDAMIEVVRSAKTSEELTIATRALDRVLRAEQFWVPQWYKDTHTVAYYDIYDHPETLPPYALGELNFWWYDAARAEALRAAGALK